MAVELKRIRPGDELDFAEIAPEVFDAPIRRARLEAYLLEPGHLMILALEDGIVVGQCAAIIHQHADKPTDLYVDEVGTASTHRRRGIATRLLEAMFDWGRELGCREAWLATERDNPEANGLYRKASSTPEPVNYYQFEL